MTPTIDLLETALEKVKQNECFILDDAEQLNIHYELEYYEAQIIALLINSFPQLKSEVSALEAERDEAHKDLYNAGLRLAELRADNERLKTELNEIQDRLSDEIDSAKHREKDIEQLKAERDWQQKELNRQAAMWNAFYPQFNEIKAENKQLKAELEQKAPHGWCFLCNPTHPIGTLCNSACDSLRRQYEDMSVDLRSQLDENAKLRRQLEQMRHTF